MRKMFRPAFTMLAVFVISFALSLSTAEARTHHKHHHSKQHARHHTKHHAQHRTKKKAKITIRTDVRTAQRNLINLGYLKGSTDGKLGPKTAAALRKFQRDHHLTITGTINTATYNALVEANMPAMSDMKLPIPPLAASDFMAKNPDFYGKTDQQFADPMVTAPRVVGNDGLVTSRVQSIPTRFGKVETEEKMFGTEKRYNVTLNDQSILMAGEQPSVIGISSTYDVNGEDAIIFSTYNSNSSICPYKHYLLTLKASGNDIEPIENCTRGYQARVNNGSLFIEFPEQDDARAIGNTWRYENSRLERL